MPYHNMFSFSTARPLRHRELRLDEAAEYGASLVTAYSSLRHRSPERSGPTEDAGGYFESDALLWIQRVMSELRRVHERIDGVCTYTSQLQESVLWLVEHPMLRLPPQSPPAKHTLHVLVEGHCAILDGRQYPLSEGQTLLLQTLLENEGHFVKSTEIAQAHQTISAKEIAKRIVPGLPKPIRNLIHAQRGLGFCLRLS